MQLRKYLDTKPVTAYRAAKDLQVRHSTMWRWLTGRSIPRVDMIRKIEAYTGGKVKAGDWIKAEPATPARMTAKESA